MAKEQAKMVAEVLELHMESNVVMEAMTWAHRILDANHKKENIENYITQQSNLSLDKQSQLKNLLFEYKSLFDGSLSKFKEAKASFKLKVGEKLYHAKLLSVPKMYKTLIQKEFNHLMGLGVLEKVQESE